MSRYIRARPSEVLESAAAVVPFRREQVTGLLAFYPPAAVQPGQATGALYHIRADLTHSHVMLFYCIYSISIIFLLYYPSLTG